jgi:hypothetical protein
MCARDISDSLRADEERAHLLASDQAVRVQTEEANTREATFRRPRFTSSLTAERTFRAGGDAGTNGGPGWDAH